MKWDEMSPRERDVFVSVRVMGLPEPNLSPYNGEMIHHFIEETYPRSGVFKEKLEKMRTLRRYTTDISAAWEVVEKMQIKGFYIDVISFSDHYMAVPHLSDGHEPANLDGVASAAPEAICKAALKAVGVDIE